MNETTESNETEPGEQNQWIAAGAPEPIAAVEVDSGECEFGCGAPADYIVEFENGSTVRCCQVCSVKNRLYAEENDLLDVDSDRL